MTLKELVVEIERLNAELNHGNNKEVNRTRVYIEQWSPEDGCWWAITPHRLMDFEETNFEKEKSNAPF